MFKVRMISALAALKRRPVDQQTSIYLLNYWGSRNYGIWSNMKQQISYLVNPIALRKAKIVYNFGLSECNRVNNFGLSECNRVNLFSVHRNFRGHLDN